MKPTWKHTFSSKREEPQRNSTVLPNTICSKSLNTAIRLRTYHHDFPRIQFRERTTAVPFLNNPWILQPSGYRLFGITLIVMKFMMGMVRIIEVFQFTMPFC